MNEQEASRLGRVGVQSQQQPAFTYTDTTYSDTIRESQQCLSDDGSTGRSALSSVSFSRRTSSINGDSSDWESTMSTISDFSSSPLAVDSVVSYLHYVAASLKKYVVTKDRRYHTQVYKHCFVASEAIDFLVASTIVPSRVHAVLLCKHLALSLKVFQHVTGEKGDEFEDEYLFFRFVGMHAIGNIRFTNISRSTEANLSEMIRDNLGSTMGLLPENWESCNERRLEYLAMIAVILKERVEVKDRRYRVMVYPESFLGTEAVSVLMEARPIARDRAHALTILRMMNAEYEIYEHVCQDHDLKDERLFYRFVDSRIKSETEGMTMPEMDNSDTNYFNMTDSPWQGKSSDELEVMIAELTNLDAFSAGKNSLSYQNNMMIRRDGTVMSEKQIRDLRQRHGFCLTCADEPVRLFVVKRHKLNPLYQKKKVLSVPGQSRRGVCLKCNPDKETAKRRSSLTNVANAVRTSVALSNSVHSGQSTGSPKPRVGSIRQAPSSNAGFSSSESQTSRSGLDESTRSAQSMQKSMQNHRESSFRLLQDIQNHHHSLLAPPLRQRSTINYKRQQPFLRSNSDDGVYNSGCDLEFFGDKDEKQLLRSISDDGMISNVSSAIADSERPGYQRSESIEHFDALHKERQMLSQALNASDLRGMIGSIRESSQLPLPSEESKRALSDKPTEGTNHRANGSLPAKETEVDPSVIDDSLSVHSDGIISNHSSGTHRRGVVTTAIDEDLGESSQTRASRVELNGFAISTETPTGQSLEDSLKDLAQIANYRLRALEKQVTLLVTQQKQQNVLIQQNTEILQKFLELTISRNSEPSSNNQSAKVSREMSSPHEKNSNQQSNANTSSAPSPALLTATNESTGVGASLHPSRSSLSSDPPLSDFRRLLHSASKRSVSERQNVSDTDTLGRGAHSPPCTPKRSASERKKKTKKKKKDKRMSSRSNSHKEMDESISMEVPTDSVLGVPPNSTSKEEKPMNSKNGEKKDASTLTASSSYSVVNVAPDAIATTNENGEKKDESTLAEIGTDHANTATEAVSNSIAMKSE